MPSICTEICLWNGLEYWSEGKMRFHSWIPNRSKIHVDFNPELQSGRKTCWSLIRRFMNNDVLQISRCYLEKIFFMVCDPQDIIPISGWVALGCLVQKKVTRLNDELTRQNCIWQTAPNVLLSEAAYLEIKLFEELLISTRYSVLVTLLHLYNLKWPF